MLTLAIVAASCGILSLIMALVIVARVAVMLQSQHRQNIERAETEAVVFERMAMGRCIAAEKYCALLIRQADAITQYSELSNFKLQMAQEQMQAEHDLRMQSFQAAAEPDDAFPPNPSMGLGDDANAIVPRGASDHGP